ncbi:hypothetical protein HDZ31DRAFT_42821 [Schizophyllum fasciatum]
MSAPHVYSPQYPLSPYQSPEYPPNAYVTPLFVDQEFSPFVPPANIGASPYNNAASLPGSPRLGPVGVSPYHTPHHTPYHSPYHSPHQSPYHAPAQLPGWSARDDTYTRERRPSWHSPAAAPQYLGTPAAAHGRRHSFSNAASPYQTPYTPYTPDWVSPQGLLSPYPVGPSFAPALQLHPWLNADNPPRDFIFDLSLPVFSPRRLIPSGTIPPSGQDMATPATHPPITRLHIVCDAIPQWPIDLEYPGGAAGGRVPPIQLGDVLIAVHTGLHRRISHADWEALTMAQEREVTRAFYKRISRASGRAQQEAIKQQGVLHVDFLLGKTWFKGLVRSGNSWDTMRLITG